MTDEAKAKQRMNELRRELERHNRLYCIDASPEITDHECDQLLQSLEELETQFPIFGSANIEDSNASFIKRLAETRKRKLSDIIRKFIPHSTLLNNNILSITVV